MSVLPSLCLSLLMIACKPEVVGDPHAIVVYMVADTLGQSMARQTDTCDALQQTVAAYGLDLACLDGAVAPSSWTAESHTRMLWPQTTVGALRAEQAPPCDLPNVLETIRDSTAGRYLWGADNSVLSGSGREGCGGSRTNFTQGADRRWETSKDAETLAPVPEDKRPVHDAISRFERDVSRGSRPPVMLFINALEPGGHRPRCWFEPDLEACDLLWQVAVDEGLVAEDADRGETWLDASFYDRLLQLVTVREAQAEGRWRPLFWETTEANVLHHRPEMLSGRVDRVLAAVAAADRLDELRLVITSDHGENPCVARGFGDDTLNCGHNGITTEYTGFVPALVAPAGLADDWAAAGLIGVDGEPWSSVNLAYGLIDDVEVPRPEDWPEPEPVGTATSWTCNVPEGTGAAGIHVEDDVAVRCKGGQCITTSFVLPDDETHVPAEVDAEALLAEWGGSPDWFSDACGMDL